MPPLTGLEHALGVWAYLAIAVLVMIEGPIATLVGAVAASAGYLKPGWVFLSAALGNLTSDILWYSLGYLGNIEWISQYGRYVGLRREQVVSMQEEIQRHVLQIVFAGKLTMGFMIPVLVATGLSRIPLRRWLWVLAFAECIWTGALVAIGYNFGHYIRTLERGLQLFALGGALIFVFITFQYLSRHRARAANPDQETD